MSAFLLGTGFRADMGTCARKLVLLKLIDACEAWHLLHQQFLAICNTGFDTDGFYCATVLPALDAIAKMPAATIDGITAKAKVFKAYIAHDPAESDGLAKSICDDLIALEAETIQELVIRHGRAA